jgi:hypothetical protein
MKIKEITENYKVMQSSPQGIELASQDGTKISLPPEKAGALQPDPTNPKVSTLDLSNQNLNVSASQGQQTGQQPPVNGQQPANNQQQTGQQSNVQSTGQQPANGQQPIPGQQPANGQQPIPGQQQQPQLPQIGSEVELDDNVGSTMQSETVDDVDDKDLIASGKNKDVGGDPTDEYIKDVTDKEFERNARRSNRNVVNPIPVRESEELIAMLTIAGLR